MIKSILDRKEEIRKYRNSKITRGENTGFKSLDVYYSVKQGTFTIVLAEPQHGKSEFIFEICLNQVLKYGKRCLIYSPEGGDFNAIVADLFLKYTGLSMIKSDFNSMDDENKFENELCFLSEYFIIADNEDRSLSIQELFDQAEMWEKEHADKKLKIDIIVGEPYNELSHDMSKYGARQDLYIEDLISNVRRLCAKRNKHFFLSIHPAQSTPIIDKKITYYPKPQPRNAAGGQALYRKAMTWITLWRPPTDLLADNGFPYHNNEVHVFIDKAKPKGVSFKGKCVLFLDWKKSRYYEDYGTGERYAFEHEKPELQQSTIFTLPSQEIEPPF